MPKEKPKVNIGEVIRSYRSDRGLSQGDIERRTGLLRCYLSRVENGHTVPSLETLAKIAEAMEISLADFFRTATNIGDRDGTNVEMVLFAGACYFVICVIASSLVKGLQKKVAR